MSEESPVLDGAPPEAGPDSPTQLSRRSLIDALKRTVKEFQEDKLTVWAAALTYYGVLSLFPGLLMLVAALDLFGDAMIRSLTETIGPATPAAVREIINGAVENVRGGQGRAGVAALIGLAVALWSAAGYVGAFMQASNAIYDVPEGRPIWKTLPIRLGVTAVTGLLLIATILIVVLTGTVAERVGEALGIGSATVSAWNLLKWPVLVVLVALMFAILYWASPNARQGGFRWISPGGAVAVVLWLVVSGLFALYAANFASYNRTYGTLGGVIVFFVWLWLTNLAILVGAEVDAELERQRVAAAGHPPDKEPYLQLRDTRKVDKGARDDLR